MKKHSKKSNKVIVGNGFPEDNYDDPIDGAMYIDDESLNVYIYANKVGWIILNGWMPDVGEGVPNIPDAKTGAQYVDVLTGDLYYYTEGFDWRLVNGIQGPPGPFGFTDVFMTCRKPIYQVITMFDNLISWDIPDYQDKCYSLVNSTCIKINNQAAEPVRFQINVKISTEIEDDKAQVIYVIRNNNTPVTGSMTYAHLFKGKNSTIMNSLVEVNAQDSILLSIAHKSVDNNDIKIDDNTTLEIIKLG
jgi:hypothetical protein